LYIYNSPPHNVQLGHVSQKEAFFYPSPTSTNLLFLLLETQTPTSHPLCISLYRFLFSSIPSPTFLLCNLHRFPPSFLILYLLL